MELQDAKEIEENKTVGEEFIEWSEKYYELETKLVYKSDGDGESMPYNFVRETFIVKINEIIKERL